MGAERKHRIRTLKGLGAAVCREVPSLAAKYVLSIDQSTTGTAVFVFDPEGQAVAQVNREITQYYPSPGWVEHDPVEIWNVTKDLIGEALAKAGIASSQLAAIGVTNQRETTVLWDRETGEPVGPAVVWQCRRTAAMCEQMKADGLEPKFRDKTGLVLDAYFSGTKIRWMLENDSELRARARQGQLAFGTVDSWLVYNLTGGTVHITDYTNASRTLLFNIHSLEWDSELLQIMEIPASLLPEVRSSSEVYGHTVEDAPVPGGIPIAGIAGDQQAALFGQACYDPGMVKATYGTGCFILMQTGERPVPSDSGLLTTIAWGVGGKVFYALEGSIFIAGAAVQWLRDELGLIETAAETEGLALSVPNTNGAYFVPAFVGLGAPYWDPYARGTLVGLTRGVNKQHIVRAALESVAYQTKDIVGVMSRDSRIPIDIVRIDGGASVNNFLAQFQADILNVPVERPRVSETTALGAAFLAGLAVGLWEDQEAVRRTWKAGERMEPNMDERERNRLYQGWQQAVRRSLNWEQSRDA